MRYMFHSIMKRNRTHLWPMKNVPKFEPKLIKENIINKFPGHYRWSIKKKTNTELKKKE